MAAETRMVGYCMRYSDRPVGALACNEVLYAHLAVGSAAGIIECSASRFIAALRLTQ